MHGDKELVEKLGRNDPCTCGSGKRFQALLHDLGPVSTEPSGRTIGGTEGSLACGSLGPNVGARVIGAQRGLAARPLSGIIRGVQDLRFTLASATAQGRLVGPDGWKQHMAFAATPCPCPFGVNIDATILMDFDSDRRLNTVEFLLPRSRSWKRGLQWKAPALCRDRDLLLPQGAAANNMVGAGVIARREGEQLDVVIGDDGIADDWVRLGEQIRAVFQGDRLIGFRLFAG